MTGRTHAALTLCLALAAAALLLSAARRHPARLDLTADGRHTLSAPTRHALAALPGDLQVEAWLPRHAPPPYDTVVRATEDLLWAARRAAGPRLRVEIHDPSDPDLSAAERIASTQAAERAGVPLADLQVIREARQVRERFPFGVAVRAGPREAVMPPQEHAGQLEYALVRALREAAPGGRRHRIALSVGRGEPEVLGSPLAPVFRPAGELTAIQPGRDPLPTDLDLLLVMGPTRPFDAAATYAVEQHLVRGGALVLLVDYRRLSDVVQSALVPNRSGLEGMLAAHGVEVRAGHTVFDHREHASAPTGRDAAGAVIRAPQPLYPRARESDHPIAAGLAGVPVPLAAPLRLSKGARALLQTGPGGRAVGDLRHLTAPAEGEAGPFTLAASLEAPLRATLSARGPGHRSRTGAPARVVVIPSATWFLAADPRALTLLQNAVDWALGEPELIALRRGPPVPPALGQLGAARRRLIEAANVFGPGLLLVVFWAGWRRRRRGAAS